MQIQLISIYYSVFTAILAVLGLVGKELNDFLDVPSVLFTIAVAILVTFANAQRCGSRANDLSSNCSDLGERFSEVTEILNRPNNVSRANHSELKECMARFYKNLGDSEEHSIVDEWKYTGNWLYSLYLSLKIVVIYLLIMIPIIFVFCYWDNFLHLFSFVGGYDNCGFSHLP